MDNESLIPDSQIEGVIVTFNSCIERGEAKEEDWPIYKLGVSMGMGLAAGEILETIKTGEI